jgi:hypothetical protein
MSAFWDEPNGALRPAARRYMHRLSLFGAAMTIFDDREQGYESKFAHDQELDFKALARRNRQLGLWAAGLMGLEGDRRDDYANAVVKSEVDLPGDEDVLRKVAKDLSASGLKVSEGEVMAKMDEFLAIARDQLKSV